MGMLLGIRRFLLSGGGFSIHYDADAQTLCVIGSFSVAYDVDNQTLCVR